MNNDYASSGVQLGYSSEDAALTNVPVGSGYYQVTVQKFDADPGATPAKPAAFSITATAIGMQAKDTACQSFSVDDKGTQTSLPAADCWN